MEEERKNRTQTYASTAANPPYSLQNKRTEMLGVIALELIRPISLKKKLNNILDLLDGHFGLAHTMILLPEGELLTVFASKGYPESCIGTNIKIGEGIIGVVAERKKKLKLNNLSWKKQYYKAAVGSHASLKPLPGLQNAESQLAIPLMNDNILIAVLATESESLDLLTPKDEDFLMMLSKLIGLSIQNTLIVDKLETTVKERTFHLQLQKEQLQRLNQSKDRMLSIIVHDLKSPVAGLKQVSGVMNYYKKEKNISGIVKTAQRIVEVVAGLSESFDSLLACSFTQNGEIEFERTRFNFERVIKQIIGIHKSSWEEKQIVIVSVFKGLPKTIESDIQSFKSIIGNFLHNAIKFSHPHSRIDISASMHQNYLELVIQDFGVGISKSKVQGFLTNSVNKSTKGTSKEPGKGLGIAASIWLARQNGVLVDISSKLKQGTVVKLRFPLRRSA